MSPPNIGEPVRLQSYDDFWTTDPERFDFDLSISKILETVEGQAQLPNEEQTLLRVSPTVLRHLASTYRIPSAFLASVSQPLDSCGTAFRRQSQHEWDYWCLLPFRLSTVENDARTAGSNQMDPSYHIYLEGQQIAIFGRTIALYMKRNCKTGKTHVFVVNYAGEEFILRPLARVRKFLKQRSSVDLDGIPCFVLLMYIACMLTWWNNALQFFNEELISHEINLQELISNETEGFINTSKVLNAALHSMAAHLHRYKTELQRTGLVLSDLRRYRGEMTYKPNPKPRDREEYGKQEDEKEDDDEASPPIDRELQKIEHLASKLAAISSSVDEMERKVQNILALLFNQIQAINDKTLQAILNASQQETRISQRLSLASHMLSRSMKRDSIAMKTVPHSRYENLSFLVVSSWELTKETLGHFRDAILY
ncbi:hypothetical protein NCS52_01459900 [Fusarium sp. LHS14.1]|nr:hypothetical protein NCS52_01459900 [Fusarium sp. LHS14.1]